MASRKIEDCHVSCLNKLLAESGIVCPTPEPSTEEESEEEEEIPESLTVEATVEQTLGEEEAYVITEEEIEETPEIFPTPSLRRVLPENLRKVEDANRMYVLPEEFKKTIDPFLIPKISSTGQQQCIDILGELTGCTHYKSSLAEYWFLDTLANLLRRAQGDSLNRYSQANLILWYCEWMKEMQHFDAADRQRMMRRFEENMLNAAKHIAENETLPAPADIGVYYKGVDEEELPLVGQKSSNKETKGIVMSSDLQKAASARENKSITISPDVQKSGNRDKSIVSPDLQKSKAREKGAMSADDTKVTAASVRFEGTAFECSLRDLTMILHYIFDLFSTDFQYDLVRSVFTFTSDYTRLDAPYQMDVPRKFYTPLKPKTKKETKSPKKAADAKGKGKKPADVLTEDYLALLELKAKDDRECDEREEVDRQEYNLRSQVLPLMLAVEDSLFDKYWPPPPAPDPVEAVVVSAGKKKK